MRAYVLTNAHIGQEIEVVCALRNAPGVVRADYTLGPYDVIVELDAPDLNTIGNLVFETIRCQPGVTDTLTCLAVE